VRILLSIFLSIAISCPAVLLAQEKFTLSGTLTSAKTGETLIAATVKVQGQPGGTSSNEYGFYSLTLPKGSYTLEFSAVGLKTKLIPVQLDQNKVLDVPLDVAEAVMESVVIKSTGRRSISNPQMGMERLTTAETKNIPMLMGERDVLKTIQLLPGIKSAGEGSSGFFVRGGAADQNLILLDEATVYNASHLLGFFSTFNADAIKDVTVYKSGMPAQYGGRLSSVLDIKMNEGNNQDYAVSGGVGLISTKLNVEGPIQKNRSSFLVSGRRTYVDAFLKLSPDSKEQALFLRPQCESELPAK
jgi:hypothetical protein